MRTTQPGAIGGRGRRGGVPARLMTASAVTVASGVALATVLGLVGAAVVSRARVGVLAALATEAPDLYGASAAQRSAPTVVRAGDGTVIGTFRPEELHVPIEPGDVPPVVAEAVVAAEDEGFWRHGGIDVEGIARAALANVRAGELRQGGSTITQQLVKNLFTDGDRTLARKVEEVRLALAIEREYPKEEILAAYLNTTYFGEGAVGIEAAARTYFRKPLAEVTLAEAALLAGVIPAPSHWNPRTDPGGAESRRQHVLDRMEATGAATPGAIADARAATPTVHPARAMPARYPFFVDYVRRWLLDGRIDAERLYRGGLEITTTLDPALQDAALSAVRDALPRPQDPQAAAVVVDPDGGEVLALVGGRDWGRSQVNLALGPLRGSVGRQPGSAFKPFVLAAALEDGRAPEDPVPAPAEVTPEGADEPVLNYARRGYGRLTLAEATRMSVNTSFTIRTEQLGPDRVADVARRLGLELPDRVEPSVGIGAYEVRPSAWRGRTPPSPGTAGGCRPLPCAPWWTGPRATWWWHRRPAGTATPSSAPTRPAW